VSRSVTVRAFALARTWWSPRAAPRSRCAASGQRAGRRRRCFAPGVAMTRHPPRGAVGEPWFPARNPSVVSALRTGGRRRFPVGNQRFPGRNSLNARPLRVQVILGPIISLQWHSDATDRRQQGSRGARRRPGAPQTAPRSRASAWTPAPRRAIRQLSAARGIDLDGSRQRGVTS
jgi:hypothetical protein